MRWLGVALVVALLALGWVAYNHENDRVLGLYGGDMSQLVYLALVLLLVSGAGYGFRRIRYDAGRAAFAIVFWGGLCVLIMLAYQYFVR
jgi:uncharacterized membrane protein